MPTPSRAALALAERFELALSAAPPPGRSGERLARTAGAGSEFHDSRAYRVGDDVRRIDWRAFARSDQLTVRVWREEALARVEVLCDVSRSMGVEPRKAQLALDLALLVALAARADGCVASISAVAPRAEPLTPEELLARGLEFEARDDFATALRECAARVRRGAIVVLISDFLFEHDPRELLAPLVARAGALGCVQILSRAEREPRAGLAERLIDCESGAALDLVLDDALVADYRRRLEALVTALAEQCRRTRAVFASLDAQAPLEDLARGPLTDAGLLAPR